MPIASVLHRTDPRIKIFGFIGIAALSLMITSIYGYLILLLFLGVCAIVSNTGIMRIIQTIRSARYIIILTVLINMIWNDDTDTINLMGMAFYFKGLINAMRMSARVCLLMMSSGLLMMTTSPQEISDALERIMMPLRWLGVQTAEIALMISISLRAVPMLGDETSRIIIAQKARGARIGRGGPIQRVKSYLPVLLPIFVSIFRRSDILATAMEARCFSIGEERTSIYPLTWGYKETLLMISMIVIFVAIYMADIYLR